MECCIPIGIPIKKLNLYKYYKSISCQPDSNYPGSKDVHGRLFWCLKSNKYRGFSAYGSFLGFLNSRHFGVPFWACGPLVQGTAPKAHREAPRQASLSEAEDRFENVATTGFKLKKRHHPSLHRRHLVSHSLCMFSPLENHTTRGYHSAYAQQAP